MHVGRQQIQRGVIEIGTLAINFIFLVCFSNPNCLGQSTSSSDGWFDFQPAPLDSRNRTAIDLRHLNEAIAGENGRIVARGHAFVHERSGLPVRFWGVNGPAARDPKGLAEEAKTLASYGVNLVRLHSSVFDESGQLDPAKIQHAADVVRAMKSEGIYTHLSFYFPLWLKPKPSNEWLSGYDGNHHPFASIFFSEAFQKQHREWMQALLHAKIDEQGNQLVNDPAVFGIELLNEDSLFFWTFNADNIPEVQMQSLESQFANWLIERFGSLDAVEKRWDGVREKRDRFDEKRVAFRGLWQIANERKQRDQDTAEFLADTQRQFYEAGIKSLREFGFKGLVCCSNWTTANAEYFGPIEKETYCVGDFIDRHGYFGCRNKGEAAEWSLRDGQTFVERSALRFELEEDKEGRDFTHPAFDPSYNHMPSMISETTWTRPNRFRSEAPLFYAVYGALQDSDAIVHFAKDGAAWSVKPNYFMQPWTLQSPAMLGQFPAAALIYRRGLISAGDLIVNVELNRKSLLALSGTPLPQDAAFDELRLKEIPGQTARSSTGRISPLVHLIGRTNVSFVNTATQVKTAIPENAIQPERNRVRSSTKEIELDFGNGLLTLHAERVVGASGNLASAPSITIGDWVFTVPIDLAHIVIVSLDDKPLSQSSSMLLQVMTEERAKEFRSESIGLRTRKIVSIGHDPWQVKHIRGAVLCNRPDASQLKVTPLKHNGLPGHGHASASKILLDAETMYYLITK